MSGQSLWPKGKRQGLKRGAPFPWILASGRGEPGVSPRLAMWEVKSQRVTQLLSRDGSLVLTGPEHNKCQLGGDGAAR